MSLFSPDLEVRSGGRVYGVLALCSLILLGWEFIVGFLMALIPGWANGWPGEIPMYKTWPVGLTVILAAMLATGSVGLSASLGSILSRWDRTRSYAGPAFGAGLLAGAALAVIICSRSYRALAEISLQTWPNGYNP